MRLLFGCSKVKLYLEGRRFAWGDTLSIGIDNFEKVVEDGYYFVDKTMFIKELLDMKGEVNLFTRPHRFGKTLNMSMLRCFFEHRNTDNAELSED